MKNRLQKKIFKYYDILLLLVVFLTAFFSYTFQRDRIWKEAEGFYLPYINESAERTQVIFSELVNMISMVGENELILENRLNSNDVKAMDAREIALIAQKQKYLSGIIKEYSVVDSILLFQDSFVFQGANFNRAEMTKPEKEQILEAVRVGRETGISFGEFCLCRTNIYFEDQIVLFKRFEEDSFIFLIFNSKLLTRIKFPEGSAYITNGIRTVKLSGEKDFDGEYVIKAAAGENGQLYGGITIKDESVSFTNRIGLQGWSVVNIIDMSGIMQALEHRNVQLLPVLAVAAACSLLIILMFSRRLLGRINSLKEIVEYEIPDRLEGLKIPAGSKLGGTNKISLRAKVFFVFFLSILLPVFSITAVSYFSFIYVIEEKFVNSIDTNLNRITYNVNFLMESYVKTISGIATDSYVIDSLSDYYRQKNVKTYESRQKEITKYVFDRLFFREGIINISIYDNSHKLFYSYLQENSASSEAASKSDIEKVLDTDPFKFWQGPCLDYFNNSYFRIGMKLRRPADSQPMGFLLLDVSLDSLQRAISNTITERDIFVAVCTGDNREISSINSHIVGNAKKQELIEGIYPKKGAVLSRTVDNFHIVADNLDSNDWRIITAVSVSDYAGRYLKILYGNMMLLLVYLFVSFFASLGFSMSLTKNLKLLEKELLKLQPDKVKQMEFPKSGDEIEELGQAFNMLIERISLLIKEVYEERLERSKTEIKLKETQYYALQAQINPHFLYNTLETIHFMIKGEDKRAVKMVQMLGKLFRLGVGNGEKYICLREEIEYVKLYVQIQQIRYSGAFSVEYIISENIMKLRILRFILQPIIENAIHHGLEAVKSGGVIEISAEAAEAMLIVKIADNGVGIEDTVLERLNMQLDGSINKKSIGMMNVHERIRLEYGAEYGLTLETVKNIGTTIYIKLPLIEDKQ